MNVKLGKDKYWVPAEVVFGVVYFNFLSTCVFIFSTMRIAFVIKKSHK